jgi:flagellar hook-associated protein 3 FlgL
MDKVSTANLHSTTLNGALSVQSQLYTAQTQESTGLVSQDFGGLGGNATYATLNLQNEINQAQTWSSQAQEAATRSQATYSALGNIISTITTLEGKVSSAMTDTTDSSLSITASSMQTQLMQQINTQSAGRYIFSGTDTNTAPVNVNASDLSDPSSYYQGNSTKLAVQVGSQQTITYGVTASDPAIAAAMKAMQSAVTASQASPVDQSALKAALADCQDAVTKLGGLQESVSDTDNQLQSAQTNQTTYVTFLQNSLSNVKDADTASVATEVSQYQTQLQASYMAVSSVTKLSLTTYL